MPFYTPKDQQFIIRSQMNNVDRASLKARTEITAVSSAGINIDGSFYNTVCPETR